MSMRLAAIALSFCGAAHGAEWDSEYWPPSGPLTFTPVTQAAPTPHTTWTSGVSASGSVLAHYPPSGKLPSVFLTGHHFVDDLVNTAGDGVAGLVHPPTGCLLHQQFWGDRGFGFWERPLPGCGELDVDGVGGFWTVALTDPAHLLRYKADGTDSLDLPLIVARRGLTADLAADPAADAAYIAGTLDVAPIVGVGKAAVERVAISGLNFWRWVDGDPGLSRALEVTVTSDGDVFAIGSVSVGEDARLIGTKLSRTGQLLRLERSLDLVSVMDEFGAGGGPKSLRAGTDGSAYVLAHRIGDPVGAQVLVRYNAAGRIDWTVPLGDWRCGCTSAATASGGIALLLYRPEAASPEAPMVIRRFATDGSSSDEAPAPQPADLLRQLQTGVPVPLDTSYPALALRPLIASTQDEAGDTYLLTRVASGQMLDKLSPAEGQVLWSKLIAATSSRADLRVRNGRACVLSAFDNPNEAFQPFVSCVDASTGGNPASGKLPFLWNYGVLVASGKPLPPVLLASGDSYRLFQPDAGPGHELWSQNHFALSCSAQDESGHLLVSGNDSSLGAESLRQFDAAGHPGYAVGYAGAACDGAGAPLRLLPDGFALVVGAGEVGDAPKTAVSVLDPNGSLRWIRFLPGRFGWNWSAVTSDAVYLAQGSDNGSTEPAIATTRVTKLARGDGTVLWQHDITERAVANPRIWFDGASARLLYAVPDGTGLRFERLDPGTGAELASAVRSCGGPACTIERAEIDALGRLQVAARLDPVAASGAHGDTALFRLDRPFDVATPYARADQSAHDGVWYSRASTGQGFVFDYIEAARTMFLSWFTFTQAGGFALSEQRWYTLQGAVPENAATVDLDILQSAGGKFAQPPITGALEVGHARLTFTSCTTAVLDYAFDAGVNGGAAGTLGLEGGGPCAPLGDPPRAPPPLERNGFDVRQSGTWYEPETSGQGFSLSVHPNPDFGAYLFGAWFTYDPANFADDPTQQHWFTLQGDLDDAVGGQVTLTISRTIGGTFEYGPTRDTFRVGVADLRFTGCGTASLDYRFDDSEVAASFAGLAGHMDLVGLGTCP